MINELTRHQREEILRLSFAKSNSVLDIGCGNGEKTFFISKHTKRTVGIDPDNNLIKSAQNNFSRQNLTFKIGCGESLNFPPASFDGILFNESLHHVPAKKQINALKESRRVLEQEGKLLIIEPIYAKGSYEEILKIYHDEKKARESAVKAIELITDKGFNLNLKKEIHVKYSCKGFDDIYKNNILTKPQANWNNENKQNILDILDRCDKTPEGDFIVDYFAHVWFFIKVEN